MPVLYIKVDILPLGLQDHIHTEIPLRFTYSNDYFPILHISPEYHEHHVFLHIDIGYGHYWPCTGTGTAWFHT